MKKFLVFLVLIAGAAFGASGAEIPSFDEDPCGWFLGIVGKKLDVATSLTPYLSRERISRLAHDANRSAESILGIVEIAPSDRELLRLRDVSEEELKAYRETFALYPGLIAAPLRKSLINDDPDSTAFPIMHYFLTGARVAEIRADLEQSNALAQRTFFQGAKALNHILVLESVRGENQKEFQNLFATGNFKFIPKAWWIDDHFPVSIGELHDTVDVMRYLRSDREFNPWKKDKLRFNSDRLVYYGGFDPRRHWGGSALLRTVQRALREKNRSRVSLILDLSVIEDLGVAEVPGRIVERSLFANYFVKELAAMPFRSFQELKDKVRERQWETVLGLMRERRALNVFDERKTDLLGNVSVVTHGSGLTEATFFFRRRDGKQIEVTVTAGLDFLKHFKRAGGNVPDPTEADEPY